jgi:tetratricopeptide (TPR) repeat protein
VKVFGATLLTVLLTTSPACDRSGDSAPVTSSDQESINNGLEAFKRGQYDKAIEFYQEALKSQPSLPRVHNLIGMAYRFQFNKQNEPALKEKEITSFRKAVELDPKYVVARINLGSSLYYSGVKDEAAKHLKLALELMPQHPDAEQLKEMIAEGDIRQPVDTLGGHQEPE